MIKLYVSMYVQLYSMDTTILSAFASRSSDSSVGFLCLIFGLFMPLAHGQLFGALQTVVLVEWSRQSDNGAA